MVDEMRRAARVLVGWATCWFGPHAGKTRYWAAADPAVNDRP
jgi:hypothetical protein